MVRHRFVQEYRGRRIVTDGKLYGIEGELITDCRYLNVQGARAAINSEAGIEERRRYLKGRRDQMALHATTALKDRTFGCMCGWRGGSAKLNKDKFGVVILCCPHCKRDFLYFSAAPCSGAADHDRVRCHPVPLRDVRKKRA